MVCPLSCCNALLIGASTLVGVVGGLRARLELGVVEQREKGLIFGAGEHGMDGIR